MEFLSRLPRCNRFLIASGNGGCFCCICRGRRLAANVIWQRRKIPGFCGLFSRLLYYYVFRAVVEPCRLAALPDNNSIRGNYLYPSSPLACRLPLLNYGSRVGGAIWKILLYIRGQVEETKAFCRTGKVPLDRKSTSIIQPGTKRYRQL